MIATPAARAASRGIPEAVATHSPIQPSSTKTSSSRTGHISLLYTPRFLHSGTPIPVGGSACRHKVRPATTSRSYSPGGEGGGGLTAAAVPRSREEALAPRPPKLQGEQ